MRLIFVESTLFARNREQYLDDEQFRALGEVLLRDPAAGTLIPGTKGLRKLRWGTGTTGKRGGLRIIYYLVATDGRCLLLLI